MFRVLDNNKYKCFNYGFIIYRVGYQKTAVISIYKQNTMKEGVAVGFILSRESFLTFQPSIIYSKQERVGYTSTVIFKMIKCTKEYRSFHHISKRGIAEGQQY